MELQQNLEAFDKEGIALFAISYDSVDVLSRFAKEHGIGFPLLADEGSSVIRQFGILNTFIKPEEEEYYGIPFPGSYLVENDGTVAASYFNREYQVRETGATVLRSGFNLPVDPALLTHDEIEGQGVIVSAELTATELRNRQHADIYVTLELEEGVHVYGQPIPDGYKATEVRATATEGIIVGDPQFPPTTPFKIEGLAEQFHTFGGKVEIVLPVVSTVREAGDAAVDLEISFQACTDQMCYLPRTEKLRLEFTTVPGVRRQET